MLSSPYFKQYIPDFEKLLNSVDIERIPGGIYCRKYLAHLLKYRQYYLNIYSVVLEKIVKYSNSKKEDIVLVDYGAGNGMLGLFAKYCGFTKVFLNDVDGNFLDAACQLATQLNIEIDGYIPGDVAVLPSFFINEKPVAIAGTDVIEHIYDLNDFLGTLRQINPDIISVFTTGANPDNFFKVRRLKKLQLTDEFEGGTPDDFALFGENGHDAFIKIREQIIRRNFKELGMEEVIKLSTATRGLQEKDIITAVRQYDRSKDLPKPPTHSTNTCNPLNGSWTERILTVDEYKVIYQSAGFGLVISNGFYNAYKKSGIVNKMLNIAITLFGKRISPFIILTGFKK